MLVQVLEFALSALRVVATVGAAVGVLWSVYRYFQQRLWVRPIRNHMDPDLPAIFELQPEKFSRDVADDPDIVRDWLREPSPQGDRHYTFILLSLRYKGDVVGFLYAHFYEGRKTIFLSYLCVDKDKLPPIKIRQKGAQMLLRWMLKAADATGTRWVHILTELELVSRPGLPSPESKWVLFQQVAQELSPKAGRDSVGVYRLGIDFRRVLIDPDALAVAEGATEKQWLLWAPRAATWVTREGNRTTIARATALHLLETLLLRAYGDSFPDAGEYQSYLLGEFARYQRELGPTVEVELNPRMTRANAIRQSAGERPREAAH